MGLHRCNIKISIKTHVFSTSQGSIKIRSERIIGINRKSVNTHPKRNTVDLFGEINRAERDSFYLPERCLCALYSLSNLL